MITEGIVAFSNLNETERFNGTDTGKYSIVITIPDKDEAKKLSDEGVLLKEYKNQKQRKFVTKFPQFEVVDAEGESVAKNIPYGSTVRILWQGSKPHPTYGVSPYFKKIKVLEYADMSGDGADDEEDF
jgi:hypothetical protein|tara:strand:- start:9410 stop:9793 length:384 start_codon:yes stop_codon:yes gene_type:complete